jgi:predicted kinase
MTPDLFVLHLSGPPASGKTTLEKALADKFPGAYLVSFDRMKWQLAGYDHTKDGPLVDSLVLGLFEVVCKRKLPVFLDFSFTNEEEYARCRKIAEENGYRFFSVQLTAPIEVLVERFHKRIQDAKRTGLKITITDEATFRETAAKKFFIPPGAILFDTSKMRIEEIVRQIIQDLRP